MKKQITFLAAIVTLFLGTALPQAEAAWSENYCDLFQGSPQTTAAMGSAVASYNASKESDRMCKRAIRLMRPTTIELPNGIEIDRTPPEGQGGWGGGIRPCIDTAAGNFPAEANCEVDLDEDEVILDFSQYDEDNGDCPIQIANGSKFAIRNITIKVRNPEKAICSTFGNEIGLDEDNNTEMDNPYGWIDNVKIIPSDPENTPGPTDDPCSAEDNPEKPDLDNDGTIDECDEDDDNDGVTDDDDVCPEVPGEIELEGCPNDTHCRNQNTGELYEIQDGDDTSDLDGDGVPAVCDKDDDGDGYLDEDDLCPGTTMAGMNNMFRFKKVDSNVFKKMNYAPMVIQGVMIKVPLMRAVPGDMPTGIPAGPGDIAIPPVNPEGSCSAALRQDVDQDGDGDGDFCDDDVDGDGVLNDPDPNCIKQDADADGHCDGPGQEGVTLTCSTDPVDECPLDDTAITKNPETDSCETPSEPGDVDSDTDGITDEAEIGALLDPNDADTDDDGVCDGPNQVDDETLGGPCSAGPDCQPKNPEKGPGDTCDQVITPDDIPDDLDGDGVLNEDDCAPFDANVPNSSDCPTGSVSPSATDTDGDGLPDDIENNVTGTDPENADTDGDGINDGDELLLAPRTDPLNPDTDGDGICDGPETVTETINNETSEDENADDAADDAEDDGEEAANEGETVTVCGPSEDGKGDNCPLVVNPDQTPSEEDANVGMACYNDHDGDGVLNEDEDGNALDNCPFDPNPEQEDQDGDGIGDVCDSDFQASTSGSGCGCRIDGVKQPADVIPFLILMLPVALLRFWRRKEDVQA